MNLSGMRESLPEVGEPPKKVCAVCQIPSGKSCSACHKVFYCSAEHQRSHWKVHKKDCPPIEIATSPELGRHFVATTDLPAGTLLLTELPVLVTPFISSEKHPGIVSCISCRSIIPSNPWTCSQCSTPFFCNQFCSMNKVHSEFECGVLSKCSVEQRDKICMKGFLGCFRAIHLKNSDHETWAKVLDLAIGTDQPKLKDEDEIDRKWFIHEILPLLGGKGVGFEEDMAKLDRMEKVILQTRDPIFFQLDWITGLQYLEASNFTQSCFPNCTKIIGDGPQFKLKVRTSVDVKKGQILSIDFMGISNLMGTMVQQHMRLDELKGTLCICPRCEDPTELGTNMSAVKCTQPDCKDGYLLPVDVRDMAMNAPWRCNRSGCKGKESTWEEIVSLTSRLNLEIETFRKIGPFTDFVQINEFLDSLKKKLHPNHYLVLGFERISVYGIHSQMMANEEIRYSLPRMDLHISMLEHLLRMLEIMDPGLSFIRVFILTLLFGGLCIRLAETYVRQRSVQRGLVERSTEVMDILLPIVKFHPEIWTPSRLQNLKESRTSFQVALDSTTSDIINYKFTVENYKEK